MSVYKCVQCDGNPSNQEGESGGLWVPRQSGLPLRTLSQNQIRKHSHMNVRAYSCTCAHACTHTHTFLKVTLEY